MLNTFRDRKACSIQRTWCQSLLSAVLLVHFEVELAQYSSRWLYQSSVWHAHTAHSTVYRFNMMPGSLKSPSWTSFPGFDRGLSAKQLCLWSWVSYFYRKVQVCFVAIVLGCSTSFKFQRKAYLLASLITLHTILARVFVYCEVLHCWKSREEGRWMERETIQWDCKLPETETSAQNKVCKCRTNSVILSLGLFRRDAHNNLNIYTT